jgi:anti-sigma B factor antagonist
MLVSQRNNRSPGCKAKSHRVNPQEIALDLDIRQTGNTCTLKLKGPFKSISVRDFDAAVESAISTGHLYLILDMEAMPIIDSSGIGAVVNALRRTKQFGGDTKLVNPSPFAAKTFKMVGILSLFGVFASEEEAIAACA